MVFFDSKNSYYEYVKGITSRNPIPFDSPATYQISVQGRIDPSWCDRLEGMSICHAPRDSGPLVTNLKGELNDQAALAGVLNTLYELHMILVRVKRLDV